MPEIAVVAKNRSSFNGIDITPDTTESTGLKINPWTPTDTSVAWYGVSISQLSGANSRSLYLGNSIDIKSANGTGKITLGTGSVQNNGTLLVNLPPAGGTLITEDQLAAASGGGGGTATNYLPLANAWTNRNTFSRLPSGTSTLTTATTLATTYALNMEISTSSDVTLGISGGGSHYLSTVQVKPQSLVVNASNIAAEVSALHITGAPTKISGAGTATSAYGLKISSTGGTGFDSAYGAYITQPSGATTNVALEMILAVKTYTGSTPTLTTGYQSSLRMSQKSVSDILTTFIEFPTVMATLASPASSVLTAAPWNLSFKGSTTSFLGTAQSYTANFFTGDFIKTIKIGTGGTSSNTQNITIGSGAVGTTRIYAQVGDRKSTQVLPQPRLTDFLFWVTLKILH